MQVSLLEFWYAAKRSSSGICVPFEGDMERARAQLYKARKESLDDSLMTLSITVSPTASNELWIVHSKEAVSGT